MNLEEQILQTAALVGPGFMALKVFYVFRAQPGRSQWEWTVWSVLAGLAIAWLVGAPASMSAERLALDTDFAQIGARLSLALVAGVLLGLLWQVVKGSPRNLFERLSRQLTDSAWDRVLEKAERHDRYVVVDTTDDMSFSGWIDTAGREDAEANLYLYVTEVSEYDREAKRWAELPSYHGILLHRDQIRRIRVLRSKKEQEHPLARGAEGGEGTQSRDEHSGGT